VGRFLLRAETQSSPRNVVLSRNRTLDSAQNVTKYCDVLAGNASNNFWVLDFMLGLLDKSSDGIYK
jgi:hypothetical protein